MRNPQGEVYDLGYQRYDGPREGRNRARRAIFENGLRTVLGIGRGGRAKVLPVLFFIATMAPAAVMVTFLAVFSSIGDILPGPGDYYSIVSILLIIFAAIMAPELLAPDRRDNILPLYLVRPLTPTDYIAARFLSFLVVALALVYSGQIVLQAGLILTAEEPLEYLRDNWLDIPRFLLVGAMIALFTTAIPMVAASFTTRRAYAAAFVIALYLVLNLVTDGTTSVACPDWVTVNEVTTTEEDGTVTTRMETRGVADTSDGAVECEDSLLGSLAPYIGLVHMDRITGNVNDLVFDIESQSPSSRASSSLHDVWYFIVYVLFTAGPGLLLWDRYRRLRL